jgi:tetratricopeptide (TPR) repeat protein
MLMALCLQATALSADTPREELPRAYPANTSPSPVPVPAVVAPATQPASGAARVGDTIESVDGWLKASASRQPQDYESVELAIRHGDAKRAVDLATAALAAAPADEKLLLLRARANIALTKADLALADIQQVLAASPASAPALTMRALMHVGRNDLAMAETDIAAAARAGGSEQRDFLFTRGRLRYGQSQYEAALTDFTAAANRSPADVLAITWRGYTREMLGRYEEALTDYDAAIAAPGATSAEKDAAQRGMKRASLGKQWQAALKVAREAEAAGDSIRVVDITTREIESKATWGSFFVLRARAFLDLGKPEPALADLDRAWMNDPKDINVLAERASAMISLDRLVEAQADLDRAYLISTSNSRIYTTQTHLFIRKQEYLRAVGAADRALELNPKDVTGFARRGTAHAALNLDDKALADFKAALDLRPGHALTLIQRAALYGKRARHQEAVSDLDAVLADKAQITPYLHVLRGRSHEALKQDDKARADYEEAVNSSSNSAADRRARTDAEARLQALAKTPKVDCAKARSDQCS